MHLPSSSMLTFSFINTTLSITDSMVMLATKGKALALVATGLTVIKDMVRSPTEAALVLLCR
jgi:hypothetical protein